MGFPMIYHSTVYTIMQGQQKIMQSKNGVFCVLFAFSVSLPWDTKFSVVAS